MDYQLVIFSTLGGLGMFIYGMKLMSDSLQHVAGHRMKAILAAVSSNRIMACLTGVGITAIIQSSSATTVMLVGFVNAGLMNLTQSIGVALGAKIGTTMTGQLLAFNITDAALPAVAIGCALRVFAKNRRYRELGGIILGFGLLFYGMELMKAGVGPFKDSETMVSFFTKFDVQTAGGIFLCVLVGALCTMVVQSSSVTVGLTMALASQGLLTLPGAAALVIGDNIGTTITAELAAIGTDISARRTARANTLCSIFGAFYMIILFPFYVDLVVYLTHLTSDLGDPELLVNGAKPNIARYVANAHTIFNLINTTLFLFLLPVLAKVTIALTSRKRKKSDDDILTPRFLDESFISTPLVALSQSRKEIVRMAEISEDMARHVFAAFDSRKIKDMGDYALQEEALDSLQRHIHNYLIGLYGEDNSPDEQGLISTQMAMVNSLERLGDTTNNIAELIIHAIENNISLSDEAMADYRKISQTALDFHHLVTTSLRENKVDFLPKARELEEALDQMRISMRNGHLERLKIGLCNVEQGLVFADMINYFERLGDYLLKVSRFWVDQAASEL